MNTKYVDLVLENCDVIRLEPKDIGLFYIGGITEAYVSQRTLKEDFHINKTKHCSHLALLINNPKDLIFDSLDGETTAYERLESCHDIAAIDIIYEDETHECIYVDWNDYNDNYNLNQKNSYYDNKLKVTVNKDNAKESLEETNNEADNEITTKEQLSLQEKKAKAFDKIVDNFYYQLQYLEELDEIECYTLKQIIEETLE